jgi:hypothetical protein
MREILQAHVALRNARKEAEQTAGGDERAVAQIQDATDSEEEVKIVSDRTEEKGKGKGKGKADAADDDE